MSGLNVYLTGVYHACQVFGERMDEDSIVGISSIAARLSRSELAPYLASKSGLDGLTGPSRRNSLRKCASAQSRRGVVLTPMAAGTYDEGSYLRRQIEERTPLNRMADLYKIVGAVTYLASEAASYTTGSVLVVDGGFTESALRSVVRDGER